MRQMAKKIIIELNERQARTVLEAVEEWFRLRLGQNSELANGLAFLGYTHDKSRPDLFDRRIQTRDALQELTKAMQRIAFGPYGTPETVPPEVHVGSDIWSALRYELGPKNEWCSTPFQMGPEPLPKITVEEMDNE